MATLVFAAAGAAVGSTVGGTFLGLSGAVIGRAVGATIGQAIDQRLMGGGSETVQQGRVDRFRLMGAGEGAPIPRIWGRMRVGGHVIWASRFQERVVRTTEGGGDGKGGRRDEPEVVVEEFRYSVSLALALCEGPILRVGRVWADGEEIDPDSIDMRVYRGTETQLPDPKIEALEGAGTVPAYRGLAYVVIEDLALGRFGNRVPQLSFEVMRGAHGTLAGVQGSLASSVRAVALVPGTGEYALATTPVRYDYGKGKSRSANRNTGRRATDIAVSLGQLREELPRCRSVSVVVSWFGDDLRCNHCTLRPKVEQDDFDGNRMPWQAGGLTRGNARVVARRDGKPIYGGTPSDQSVVEAIKAIRAKGMEAVFYPFVLMEQLAGNGRLDPWSGREDQPAMPWRGRITLSTAPGRAGSPDRTVTARDQVREFFGAAERGNIRVVDGRIVHEDVPDWGYRRFILHYARLCQLAGGVDAFCIGSELRGLTSIREAGDRFPAVAELRRLAADVRAILGPEVKIGYAADWSEWWGHVADGNRYFHLDPLWSDANVDFIGIDNYMPLSDWREGPDHADAHWGSIYRLDYLKANIAGGEGFDWYYEDERGAEAQRRLPITDGEHGEPWIWRYKDIRSWWSLPHHERIGGVRQEAPTGWVPASKPIWFTEYGCAAVDRATNQPNLFVDPHSSEGALPRASTGRRDDLIQMQYLRAMADYWSDPGHNPMSGVYDGPMVDMARAHVWAWDARPFPHFPARRAVWTDAGNYARGHWLNGRATALPTAAVVGEIVETAGGADIDCDRLAGLVRGYAVTETGTARAALQPLMIAQAFDSVEREGRLSFVSRDGRALVALGDGDFVAREDGDVEFQRGSDAELPDEVRVVHVESDGSYGTRLMSERGAGASSPSVAEVELPLLLGRGEARTIARRMLADAQVSRDVVRFTLPRSRLGIGAGDVVQVEGRAFRIDRVEAGEAQDVEAIRIEPSLHALPDVVDEADLPQLAEPAGRPMAVFLDLPLITGEEQPHAPRVAVSADPWPGRVVVWSSDGEDGFETDAVLRAAAVLGETETPLFAAPSGVWDRGAGLRVRLAGGALASASVWKVLNGANMAVIGDGSTTNWEVFQFTEAVPLGADLWELRMRLRGQAGTDGVMPDVWPAGSVFALVTPALRQLRMRQDELGLVRTYRIGPADEGVDGDEVLVRQDAFTGIGRRPYPVAHLRVRPEGEGRRLRWKRRTRIGGDRWEPRTVPLGEAAEAYLVQVRVNGAVRREVEVPAPDFLYTAAMRAQDGALGGCVIEVAQLSDSFGPGPFRAVAVV